MSFNRIKIKEIDKVKNWNRDANSSGAQCTFESGEIDVHQPVQ